MSSIKGLVKSESDKSQELKADIKIGQDIFAAELGKQKFEIEKIRKKLL